MTPAFQGRRPGIPTLRTADRRRNKNRHHPEDSGHRARSTRRLPGSGTHTDAPDPKREGAFGQIDSLQPPWLPASTNLGWGSKGMCEGQGPCLNLSLRRPDRGRAPDHQHPPTSPGRQPTAPSPAPGTPCRPHPTAKQSSVAHNRHRHHEHAKTAKPPRRRQAATPRCPSPSAAPPPAATARSVTTARGRERATPPPAPPGLRPAPPSGGGEGEGGRGGGRARGG